MLTRTFVTAFIAGTIVATSTTLAESEPTARRAPISREQRIHAFSTENPGAALQWSRGRIKRVWGASFSRGATARDSARRFLRTHSGMFGVPGNELVPNAAAGPVAPERTQALGYDRATGTYRFTAVRYEQTRDGVPVYGASMTLLVRNDADHPLVLANPDVRDLGAFRVDRPALERACKTAPKATAIARFGADAEVVAFEPVIWAGLDGAPTTPRLAVRADVLVGGVDPWRIVTDAKSDEILYEEHRIYALGLGGSVSGLVTDGIAADICESEVSRPVPYARVTAGGQTTYTDASGNFWIPDAGPSSALVSSSLHGRWFDVFNQAGPDVTVSSFVGLPGSVDLLLNASNSQESVRAEVNAYESANRIRDFVLDHNPSYPTLQDGGFTINVNFGISTPLCNGYAWYNAYERTLNFCSSIAQYPNTAFSSLVFHEYGHHLIEAAGSSQRAYGEGMGDVMSVLLLDEPELGLGADGNCITAPRTADNDCQYLVTGCSTCGSASHLCGQVLSGAVWKLRNELRNTHPSNYREILAELAINAILLHTSDRIDPGITIDYLTLDDDNGNLLDGTPHSAEILTAFSAHGLDAPAIGLDFPLGQPDIVSPSGTDTIRVEVRGVTDAPRAGTGTLHASSTGALGTFAAIPMVEVLPNVYDAAFPAGDCAGTWYYYVSAESTDGSVETLPFDAPITTFRAMIADQQAELFADGFTSDLGWQVTNSPGLGAGAWERGFSFGPSDIDGDEYAYVTGNTIGLGNNDVDFGRTTLTSPVIDARSPTPVLSYFRWFYAESADPSDVFRVKISDDGGTSWSTLEVVDPNGPEADGEWVHKTYRLAEYVDVTETFRVRFTATDVGGASTIEAAIDGVVVTGYACDPTSSCRADLNGSGSIGFDDLQILLQAWGPCPGGACPADLNASGAVGFDDLQILLQSWGPC